MLKIFFENHCFMLKTFQPENTQIKANVLLHRIYKKFTSGKAVDGNFGKQYMFNSGSEQSKPYLVVDLGKILTIWGVVIYPRNPAFSENRFMGIDVSFWFVYKCSILFIRV